MDTPRLCVMIPTYNQSQFIAKAVQSVLVQDYPNIEIVIADDNSTDGSFEAIKEYLTLSNVKYFKNSKNLGRVANYKMTLHHHVDSDWVLNLDGDDYFSNPHFISTAMQAIIRNGADRTLFYQGSARPGDGSDMEQIFQNDIAEMVVSGKDYFLGFFKRNEFYHMSIIYNRELALKNHFYEQDVISSDIHSFLELCLNEASKDVILSNIIAGYWVQHSSNTSKNLRLLSHWKNFRLYGSFLRSMMEKGYGLKTSLGWLWTCTYGYWVNYIQNFWQNLKSRLN